MKKDLDELRHLVGFRQTSIATGKLLQKLELTLTKDSSTRWSSTYLMMSRALEVKEHFASIAPCMTRDSLQARK